MSKAPRPIRIDPDQLALDPLELDPGDFQSPLPQQNYALVFEDDGIGLAVGIWDTTTMQEAFGPYPGDEYITVLDGQFSMVDAVNAPLVSAQAGASVAFRNGAPSSWLQDGYLRKIYLTLQDPKGAPATIASAKGAFPVVDPGQGPRGEAGADGVTREMIFRNDAGSMTVSLCAFPSLQVPSAPMPVHRLIRVLTGKVTLTEPASQAETFGPDAHVFLPKGTNVACAIAGGTVVVIVDVTAP